MVTAEAAAVTTQPLRIAFVGVGQIGIAMFRRLEAAGHNLVAVPHNKDHARRLGLADIPILQNESDLAARPVVISSLYDHGQQADAFLGPNGLVSRIAPGSLVISHTTGDPAALQQIDAELRKRGSQAVEATFSGDAASIARGRLTLMLSGEDPAIDRAEEVLRAYSDIRIRCGSLGNAQRLKLLNNLTFAANAQLALEALATGSQLGLDSSIIIEALMASSGASRALGIIAEFPDPGAFVTQVGRYMTKDVSTSLRVADALGVSLPHLSSAATSGPIATGVAN